MAGKKKTRIDLAYETKKDGASKTMRLPLRMMVTGDWAAGQSKEAGTEFEKRTAYNITPGNMDEVMDKMDINLNLEVKDHLHGGETANVKLPVRRMKDLTPDQIAQNVPDIKELLDLRAKLADIKEKTIGPKDFSKTLKRLGDEVKE